MHLNLDEKTLTFESWLTPDAVGRKGFTARRDDAGNKVVSLKDCTPDVTLLQKEMLSKADYVIIKLDRKSVV